MLLSKPMDITVLATDKARSALRPCLRLRAVILGWGRLRRDADCLSLQRDVEFLPGIRFQEPPE